MIILQFPMWVHVAYYQYTSIQRIWDALVAVLVLFCADMGLGFFSASFWLVPWFSWLFLFYFNFLVLGLSTPVVLDLWFLLDIYLLWILLLQMDSLWKYQVRHLQAASTPRCQILSYLCIQQRCYYLPFLIMLF